MQYATKAKRVTVQALLGLKLDRKLVTAGVITVHYEKTRYQPLLGYMKKADMATGSARLLKNGSVCVLIGSTSYFFGPDTGPEK